MARVGQVDDAKLLKATRKSANIRIAFIANAAVSLFVALCGIRVLTLLIDPCQPAWGACTAGSNLTAAPTWWQLSDVLLSAGILGGGANGVHQLTQMVGAHVGKIKAAATGRHRKGFSRRASTSSESAQKER